MCLFYYQTSKSVKDGMSQNRGGSTKATWEGPGKVQTGVSVI